MSPRLAVISATIMVGIKSRDAKRVASPISNSTPQTSSTLPTKAALAPGAGMPSDAK